MTVNESDASLIPDADYLVVHVFNPIPPYILRYIAENNQTLIPVAAELYQEQPVVIAYQINKEAQN